MPINPPVFNFPIFNLPSILGRLRMPVSSPAALRLARIDRYSMPIGPEGRQVGASLATMISGGPVRLNIQPRKVAATITVNQTKQAVSRLPTIEDFRRKAQAVAMRTDSQDVAQALRTAMTGRKP